MASPTVTYTADLIISILVRINFLISSSPSVTFEKIFMTIFSSGIYLESNPTPASPPTMEYMELTSSG